MQRLQVGDFNHAEPKITTHFPVLDTTSRIPARRLSPHLVDYLRYAFIQVLPQRTLLTKSVGYYDQHTRFQLTNPQATPLSCHTDTLIALCRALMSSQ